MMRYSIEGTPLPVVICNLQPGESMITESGAMAWMSPNMHMESVSGGFGKAFGRMFSGESIFLNRYTAMQHEGMISFASSFPGSIRPLQVRPDTQYVVQKSGFLAAEATVELSVHFQKRLGAGFFGGEGFVMQRLSGSGLAFIEIDGHAIEYDLAPGQQLIIDTGYLAAMDASCQIDVVTVPGIKNMLFGGEGIFNTVVTGPGHIILQSQPLPRFAGVISRYIPRNG